MNTVVIGIVTLHWITSDPSETDLGRVPSGQQLLLDVRKDSAGYTPRPIPVVIDDSFSRAADERTAHSSRAWADDETVDTQITVPDKIFVTTNYGVSHPHLLPRRMRVQNASCT